MKIPRFLAWIETESGCKRVESRFDVLQKKNPPNWKITLLKKGKRPTSHRSTTYPCYVPILGDFAGADRVGLAVANIQLICIFTTELINFCVVSCSAIKNHYEKF